MKWTVFEVKEYYRKDMDGKGWEQNFEFENLFDQKKNTLNNLGENSKISAGLQPRTYSSVINILNY